MVVLKVRVYLDYGREVDVSMDVTELLGIVLSIEPRRAVGALCADQPQHLCARIRCVRRGASPVRVRRRGVPATTRRCVRARSRIVPLRA